MSHLINKVKNLKSSPLKGKAKVVDGTAHLYLNIMVREREEGIMSRKLQITLFN